MASGQGVVEHYHGASACASVHGTSRVRPLTPDPPPQILYSCNTLS
jgi:hypothetical protein